MHILLRPTALLIALVTGASFGAVPLAARADTSYPIYCHAGPSMKVEYVLYAFTTSVSSRVDVGFEKAPGIATASMPPGQCSWPDRPLNADEPSIICNLLTEQTQFHGFAGKDALFPIESHQLGYLPGIYTSSQFYKFTVYNYLDRGARCLRVTAPVVVETPRSSR